MAKPMLVTLPLVLLLLDYWPLGRWTRATAAALIREKLPLLGLAVASIAITLVAQRDALQPLDTLPLHDRLANAAQAYVACLGDLIVPVGLAVSARAGHSTCGPRRSRSGCWA